MKKIFLLGTMLGVLRLPSEVCLTMAAKAQPIKAV